MKKTMTVLTEHEKALESQLHGLIAKGKMERYEKMLLLYLVK